MFPSATPPGSMLSRCRSIHVTWVFFASGVVAAILVAVSPPAVGTPVLMVTEAATMAATVVGMYRNQPPGGRMAWWAIIAAELTFCGAGILRATGPAHVRPFSLNPHDPAPLVMVGYALMGWAFAGMLHLRRARQEDPTRADAVLIALTAALAAWTFLVEPHTGSSGLSVDRGFVMFFPVVDTLLVVIFSQLILAEGARQAALWLFVVSTSTILVTDVTIAVVSADRQLHDRLAGVLTALGTIAFLAVGAAALHPTMRSFAEPRAAALRTYGRLRTAGITVVLLIPSAVATLAPPSAPWSTLVRFALTAMLTATVVKRSVEATNLRALAEDAARHRATHDALTNLPNRELLAETLTCWVRQTIAGRQVSLLLIDLDQFKMVNDRWGHQVGDELLCAVAERLQTSARGEDLVCRVGGDEFAVAMAGTAPLAPVDSLARRLLQDFAEPFALSVGNLIVTPSIGIAGASGATSALDLIRDADTAMYKAKDAGRNTYAAFDASLRARARTRVDLEQALRGAMDRHELSVYYQPIVDLRTDEWSGFEALMRWTHPDLGAVSPMEFIPLAEETGLIVASGAWLLDEAVGQLARWHADRRPDAAPLHVSVNVSFRQLRDAALVDVVGRALDRTGLPASALWLEITESGVMEDPTAALATLTELHRLGVRLCIDDFGTGYSSLSYLNRFPVSIVKIDRSFVSTLGEDDKNEAIVRTVVAMAHTLGQQVVAEGVETTVQRDWLRSLGCDMVQGWLYAAAQPAEALTGRLGSGATVPPGG